MHTPNIPEGYNAVMPYLIVKNATSLLAFMKEVLGATEKHMTYRDDQTTIAHAEAVIGGSCIMFSEATDDWAAQTAGLFVYVPDADVAYAKALEVGAESVMGLSDQSYGRTCGVKDSSGNTWWITSVSQPK